MTTFTLFNKGPYTIPGGTSWYLADLGEFRGKQELYTQQSPQRLKTLREHALIESAVSSNRMEGVTVDPERVKNLLISPKPLFRDRDEEEVRGYREALGLIHDHGEGLAITEDTVRRLHRMTRGEIWDAGCYKDKDGDIIERYPDGRERVRFRTVPASATPQAMEHLIRDWDDCLSERRVHPLIGMAAFNLDFLCIHPFRDGNGRVSRLLLLLQCQKLGYDVGRYISLERLVEQNKESYYETLEQSSQGWHTGEHDPWPYINFILYILKTAYQEFTNRVGDVQAPRGSKTDLVLSAITRQKGDFAIADIQKLCPTVGIDMLRRILRQERESGRLSCLGRGPNARWRRIG